MAEDCILTRSSSVSHCFGPNKATSDVLRSPPPLGGLQQVASLVRIYGQVLLVQCKQTKFYGANTERSWTLRFDCTMTEKHGFIYPVVPVRCLQEFQQFNSMTSWKTIISNHIFVSQLLHLMLQRHTTQPKPESVFATESLKGYGGNVFLWTLQSYLAIPFFALPLIHWDWAVLWWTPLVATEWWVDVPSAVAGSSTSLDHLSITLFSTGQQGATPLDAKKKSDCMSAYEEMFLNISHFISYHSKLFINECTVTSFESFLMNYAVL